MPSVAEPGHRGSQVRLRRVPEFLHERVAIEDRLHDAALDALAAAVDQPHLAEARLVCGRDVLVDDRWNVARGKRVEIEDGFDGKADGVVGMDRSENEN